MSRKILAIFCTLVVMISILTVNVYAAISSATFQLKTSKEEYNIGDTIEVTLRLTKLEADKGIVAYSGVLNYDKDNLEYVSIKGAGEWEKPEYNSENGMLVATRSDFSPLDAEDLCVITFKAKSKGENVKIAINNIELSNGGSQPATGYKAEKNVVIKEADTNSDEPTNKDDPNNNTNNNSNNNTNNNSNNNSNNNTNNNSNNNSNNNTNNNQNNNSNNQNYEKDDGSDKLTGSQTQNQNTANKIIPQTGIDNEYILALLLMTTIVGTILATRVIKANIKK